jgi:diguanylate cyclase (GGDEF)-like protein
MQTAGNILSLLRRLVFVPSSAVIFFGAYLALHEGSLPDYWVYPLGVCTLACGAFLWLQTYLFLRLRERSLAAGNRAQDFERRARLLESRTRQLQREVELLTAQREVSRVATDEVEEKHFESLLYEILRVVNNLISVETAAEVNEIAIFLRNGNAERLSPAALKRQETVQFGKDIDTSDIDLSLMRQVEKHRTTVSSVEKNAVELALPLISDQDLMGVMYVSASIYGERSDISDTLANLQGSLREISQHVSIPLTRHVLKSSSITDGLTRLHNKSYFLERLDEHFNMFRRGKEALSVLMIDIDHFKKINDEYGHLAGDTILTQVAEKVTHTIRGYDVAFAGFRYGGEEISVLLPRTDEKRALRVARRLRKDMADNEFETDTGRGVGVTVSVGLAQAASELRNKEELISRADAALYRAKRTGRNRVCAWKPQE